MTRQWNGQGTDYTIDWAGSSWTLRLAGEERPGLYLAGHDETPCLVLAGLASEGRLSTDPFQGTSLSRVERRGNRIEATYLPNGWNGLRVRAAWQPHADDAVDLEITTWTRDPEPTRSLEVLLGDAWSSVEDGPRHVEPRDRLAAGSSYDGRESNLVGLTTGPVHGETPLDPLPSEIAGLSYVELVSSQDVARRVGRWTPNLGLALFGFDLERGVTLRGRIRGVLLQPGADLESRIDAEADRFFHEPPPLGR
ncbi:hypothetical protein EP7_000818 [Isosphaeraceae bacterium EP7]